MRIGDPISSISDGKARISASVTWEDCSWPQREIYFDTDARFADDLTPDPNAFLLATVIPALYFGERRVLVEGQVCPQLREGLITVMQQLRAWYGDDPVIIEAAGGFAPSPPPAEARVACCMSGGVDSLATFRQNRNDFPLSHAGSVKDAIFIYGYDMGGLESWEENLLSFERTKSSLSDMVENAGATLIPIYTNIRSLEEDSPGRYFSDMFARRSFAACLAAAGHALSRRVTTLLIASSHVVTDLEPWGSHPILDPNFSSATLAVRHDGLRHSRLEKLRLISEWDAGLQSLRVCADPLRNPDTMNCGKCEKCLRTMVALLVFGKLEQCMCFEANEVTPSQIESLSWTGDSTGESFFAFLSPSSAPYWRQLAASLRQIKRLDLADAISAKLKEYDQIRARMRWKSTVKWLDRKILGGTLSKLYRRARRKRVSPAR